MIQGKTFKRKETANIKNSNEVRSFSLWHKLFRSAGNIGCMKNNNKTRKSKRPHHENPLPGEISPLQRKENARALHQADKDMSKDAGLSAQSKNDDLDEGEAARLGEENTDLV